MHEKLIIALKLTGISTLGAIVTLFIFDIIDRLRNR